MTASAALCDAVYGLKQGFTFKIRYTLCARTKEIGWSSNAHYPALPNCKYSFLPMSVIASSKPSSSQSEIYCFLFQFTISSHFEGPDSAVGIATDYGLEGPGIESRLG